MENCCENRPNFGRPVCVDDFGTITSVILVPLYASNGSLKTFGIGLTYEDLYNSFFEANPSDRLYGFPQLENVEYTPADALKEEGASGRKSHLRDGIITISAETWDKDATAVIKGKMSKLRCSDWGIFFVTDKNLIVGSTKEFTTEVGIINTFIPIKIDSQSVDSKFMFKTNAATQKVMLTFDLDRNFKDETYYAISGDALWSTAISDVGTLDFNDLPKIIDAGMEVSSISTTGFTIVANDDYRQGSRNTNNTEIGNIVGLTITDFKITNVTDNVVVVATSVTESQDGQYEFVVPIQTSGDKMKVELVIADGNPINYNGSVNFQIA